MSDSNDNFCQLVGTSMQFSPSVSTRTLINLRNAAETGTYKMLNDGYHRDIGYLAWASINKESFALLAKGGVMPTYGYEWNEGYFVFLTDVLYRAQSRFALRKIVSDVFSARRIIIFLRKGRVSIYRRHGDRYKLVGRKTVPT